MQEDEIKQNALAILEQSRGVEEVGKSSLEFAVHLIREIQARVATIETWMAPLKEQARHAWKLLCEREASLVAPLEEEKQRLKQKISQYLSLLDKSTLTLPESLEDAADMMLAQNSVPKVKGLSVREEWSYEVTDSGKIPVEFLRADEKKIKRLVSVMGKGAEETVPGIRVFKNFEVSVRG